MSDLSPIITMLEESKHSHVVLFLSDLGVHIRPESEIACILMASIINDAKGSLPLFINQTEAKVFSVQDCLSHLRSIEEEQKCQSS